MADFMKFPNSNRHSITAMYADKVISTQFNIEKNATIQHNKDSLKQPQITLVVPGGALGTQTRRSAEEDTRPEALYRRSASPVDMCAAAALSQSLIKTLLRKVL